MFYLICFRECLKQQHLVGILKTIYLFSTFCTTYSYLYYKCIHITRLGVPDLGISEKYQKILQNFGKDIEMIYRIYTKQKTDPPIAPDLPPMAGNILWARQLYSCIQEPMDLFQQMPGLLSTPDAKPIIRNYNRVAKVLLEFEVLYHQSWMAQVSCLVESK